MIQVQRSGSLAGAFSIDIQTIQQSIDTATFGVDYSDPTPTTLNWNDGEGGLKTVSIELPSDGVLEGSETFTIALVNPSGVADLVNEGQGTVTILDEDQLRISIADADGIEKNGNNSF